MKVLELFSGTGSVSRVFEKFGHQTLTLDIDERFNPDLLMDIMDFDIDTLEGWKPDVIWASPPCTCFSVAAISHNWTGGVRAYVPKRKEAEDAIRMVEKTLEIIDEISPRLWFIENPRGVLRKMECMRDLPRHTVTYCQYGDTRMKPTDIWTNAFWHPRPMCRNGDYCHDRAPRGSKTGTQGLKDDVERGCIPYMLCWEIMRISEMNIDSQELMKRAKVGTPSQCCTPSALRR